MTTATDTAAVRAAFLADIIEHPDCDDRRLIFADWLEDHGEELLAGWIRSMIASGRPLRFMHEFVRSWAPDLLGTVVPVGAAIHDHVEIRRGFVHTVRCPTATWLQHRVELVRSHPIQRVELTDKKPAGPFANRELPWQWCIWMFEFVGSWGPDEVNENLVGKREFLHMQCATEPLALDWLSERLIARAKELAKEAARDQ